MKRKELWINVYPDGLRIENHLHICESKEEANKKAFKDRTGLVRIAFDENSEIKTTSWSTTTREKK